MLWSSSDWGQGERNLGKLHLFTKKCVNEIFFFHVISYFVFIIHKSIAHCKFVGKEQGPNTYGHWCVFFFFIFLSQNTCILYLLSRWNLHITYMQAKVNLKYKLVLFTKCKNKVFISVFRMSQSNATQGIFI